MCADRSRSPRRRDEVWVHQHGQKAIRISIDELEEPKDAMSILKAAKQHMSLTIGIDRLSLFTDASRSEPIDDTISVDVILRGTREAPLFLHHVEPKADSDKDAVSQQLAELVVGQKALADGQKALINAAQKATEISQAAFRVMMTPRLSTTHDRDPDFRNAVYCYQSRYVAMNQCIVLSQRFPLTAQRSGFTPTIADHILPHCETSMFSELQMDRDDARNGLPLLDHIEELYGRGLISFMPESSQGPQLQLRMLVAQRIQDQYLQCHVNRHAQWVQLCSEEAMQSQQYPCAVQLSALHNFCFNVRTIFLRSLFLRANAAHKVSQDLPDPCAAPEKFEDCPSLQAKLEAFFVSQGEGAGSIDPPDCEQD
ncbi:unnamed protein product [Symbiodinium sp. CCMP2592]|nr:unnamed protein product [Symbiodinium sp. CCMP2592]